MPFDQPRRSDGLPGRQRVPHRVIGQTMLLTPGRRVVVQRRGPAGLFLLRAGAEQVGEQLVVASPAAHLIQWHQEQAGLFHLLQHRLAIGAAGDLTQPAAEAFQRRGLQQEGAPLLRLAL
jgi:hypothetical protein